MYARSLEINSEGLFYFPTSTHPAYTPSHRPRPERLTRCRWRPPHPTGPAQSCSRGAAGAASPPVPGASPGTGAPQSQRTGAGNSSSSPASAGACSARASEILKGFGPGSRGKVGPMSVGRRQGQGQLPLWDGAEEGNWWLNENHSPQQGHGNYEAPGLSLEVSPKSRQQDRV